MIGKFIRIFFKLAIIEAIVIGVIVLFCLATCDVAKEVAKPADYGYRNMSKIVRTYKDAVAAPVGVYCVCPICMKNINNTLGASYLKTSPNQGCCCPEHEREYQLIYAKWVAGENDEAFNAAHNIKFK